MQQKNKNNTIVELGIPMFRILSSKYQTPIVTINAKTSIDVKISDIRGLWKIMINDESARLLTKNPFRDEQVWTVAGTPAGISMRMLIDETRKVFHHRYRHETRVPAKSVDHGGEEYSATYHLSCLFVEKILYDQDNKILIPKVTGFPRLEKQPPLPF